MTRSSLVHKYFGECEGLAPHSGAATRGAQR